MRISPKLQTKEINECIAGELVRVPWGASPIGIIVEGNNSQFLVEFNSDASDIGPHFSPCAADWPKILSYGDKYEIRIDVLGPYEGMPNKLCNFNGAIFVEGANCIMRIAPEKGLHIYSSEFLDLATFKLTKRSFSNSAAVFAHWDLRLPVPGEKAGLVLFKYAPKIT